MNDSELWLPGLLITLDLWTEFLEGSRDFVWLEKVFILWVLFYISHTFMHLDYILTDPVTEPSALKFHWNIKMIFIGKKMALKHCAKWVNLQEFWVSEPIWFFSPSSELLWCLEEVHQNVRRADVPWRGVFWLIPQGMGNAGCTEKNLEREKANFNAIL